MGLGRGEAHVKSYLALPNVEVAYLCDVDDRRVAKAKEIVLAKGQKAPRPVTASIRLTPAAADPSLTIRNAPTSEVRSR